MSNGFKFELNTEGVGELLNSDDMRRVLQSYADEVAKSAGAGYEASIIQSSDRLKGVSARVSAKTQEAEQDNYENNTLLRSL